MEEKDQNTEISDIYIAAYLLSKGYTCADIRRSGDRVILDFKGDVHEEMKNYFEGKNDAVSANSLFRNLKSFRSMLYNYK